MKTAVPTRTETAKKEAINREKIELNLAIAKGMLAHEGLSVSEETEQIVRARLEGKLTEKEAIELLKKK